MNRQQRNQLIENQSRAYIIGFIENINEQWVFFDEETDEALMLEQYFLQEVEIFYRHQWLKGILEEDGKITMPSVTFFLHDQMKMRVRKQLTFSLELLLNDITDEAFWYFIRSLNKLRFSIFDCIYCHNQLSYLGEEKTRSGVNFLIFDNNDSICAVQHHFTYAQDQQDRFEFTLSTGKRTVVEKVTHA